MSKRFKKAILRKLKKNDSTKGKMPTVFILNKCKIKQNYMAFFSHKIVNILKVFITVIECVE